MHGTAVLATLLPRFDPRIPLKYQIDVYIRNSVEIRVDFDSIKFQNQKIHLADVHNIIRNVVIVYLSSNRDPENMYANETTSKYFKNSRFWVL